MYTDEKVRLILSRPQLTSLHSDPERILRPAAPLEVTTRSEMLAKSKEEVTSTSISETILSAGKSNNKICHYHRVKKQQVKSVPTPGVDYDLIAPALQEMMMANEVNSLVANTLTTFLDMVEEAVEQLFELPSLVLKRECVLWITTTQNMYSLTKSGQSCLERTLTNNLTNTSRLSKPLSPFPRACSAKMSSSLR